MSTIIIIIIIMIITNTIITIVIHNSVTRHSIPSHRLSHLQELVLEALLVHGKVLAPRRRVVLVQPQLHVAVLRGRQTPDVRV